MSNRTLIVVAILFTLSFLAICDSTVAGAGSKRKTAAESRSPVIENVEQTVSNISCGAATPCPEGMECWTLADSSYEGPRCVTPNPAAWYCKDGTKPVVSKSDPPMLTCQ